MNDLISRQAALDAADEIIKRDASGENVVVNAMIAWSEYIKTIPAAHPELNEWCTDCKEYDQKAHCCHRFSNVIRGTVDEMQSNRWIPVSERLPEPEGHKEYLVTVAHYDPHYTARLVEVEEYDARDEEAFPHWVTGWSDGIRVVAWQPLPAPYRPEE